MQNEMSNQAISKYPVFVTKTSHPFDGSEESDVILRTSDNMDFCSHRAILSVASSFFKGMFSLPRRPSDDVSVPTIDVPEDSKVLDTLLRYCYPVMDLIISDLTLLVDVLEAAMKYEMTLVITTLYHQLPAFVQDQPLKLFALACCLHLEDITLFAAQRWRHIAPRASNESVGKNNYIQEMDGISAGAYYRLIRFVNIGELTILMPRNHLVLRYMTSICQIHSNFQITT
ncbi:hypothetical protein BDQ17DRAFT_1314773 [Cyathus striatus]|nr:hypothetical protein BDQ17DRAFT_1314773 [Cyathus striatus]